MIVKSMSLNVETYRSITGDTVFVVSPLYTTAVDLITEEYLGLLLQ